MEKRTPFFPQQMYHVFNRGNGNEPIFRCNQNYEFFMRKYHTYMAPWWDTHAWSLLPDQFHFIITVKPQDIGTDQLTKMISRSFGDFCNGYVQAYNKHHHRKGSLLRRAYKRSLIYKSGPIRDLVCFMHNRPVLDTLVITPEEWEYSSYMHLLSKPAEEFITHPLLKHFGSQGEFLRAHNTQFGSGSLELNYITAA